MIFEKPGEAALCATVRRAVAQVLGEGTYRSWLDPLSFDLRGGTLVIIADVRPREDHLRDALIGRIRAEARRFNLWVEVERDDRRRGAAA